MSRLVRHPCDCGRCIDCDLDRAVKDAIGRFSADLKRILSRTTQPPEGEKL